MRSGVDKNRKQGVEITNWKVGDADAFEAIAPAWTDEELDIEPNESGCYDAVQEKHGVQMPEQTHKTRTYLKIKIGIEIDALTEAALFVFSA